MKSLGWIMALWATCLAWSGASAQNNADAQTLKFNQLLRVVDRLYVDTVDVARLTEVAIIRLLEELDPHSVYLTREEVQEANEPLEGGFFGIGIQFNILGDTLMVVDVIPGGPSERVGLLAGDRIVTIDGENVVGIGLTNTGVRKRLKGEENSIVKVSVFRGRYLLEFNIRRGMIPIHSVDASYMLEPGIGYLRLARFAATTVREFEQALRQLKEEGLEDLIIDLQENPGGYMGAAVELADHLLDSHRLLLYTSGKEARANESYHSTPDGLFQRGRVIILQNESSASASEILAGAVQDWDRGLIVGRRSFGKGLVQRPIPLQDGSMVRLTIAHYYTPSGRSIQKPYRKGENYRAELYDRYDTGELFSRDSIRVTDTTRYFTKERHRLVHGGGGIVPDLFVPIDTSVRYAYFNLLMAKGVLLDYEFYHVNRHRAALRERYPAFRQFKENFEVTPEMIREIVQKGEEQGVAPDDKLLAPVLPELKRYLKALIARDLWGMNEYYKIINEGNAPLRAALKALRDGSYEKTLKTTENKPRAKQ